MASKSPVSISGSGRWVFCPASVYLEKCVPPEPFDAAKDAGIQAHKLAGELIDCAARNIWYSAPDQVPGAYDPDQKVAAWLFAHNVRGAMFTYRIFGSPHFGIEQSLAIDDIFPGVWGKPDCYIYSPNYNELIIWEFKYGFTPVESFENWQMIGYGLGLARKLGLTEDTTVYLRVIQPRNWKPMHHWKTTVGGLDPYFDYMITAARRVLSDSPTATPGKWCKWCRAKHLCDALDLGARFVCDYVESPMPHPRNATELATELAILDEGMELLTMRRASMAEHAAQYTAKGESIPGYHMKPGSNARDWVGDREQAATVADGYKVNIRKSIELMTPLQAIKAGVPDVVVRMLSEPKNTKPKIERSSKAFARKVFGGKL